MSHHSLLLVYIVSAIPPPSEQLNNSPFGDGEAHDIDEIDRTKEGYLYIDGVENHPVPESASYNEWNETRREQVRENTFINILLKYQEAAKEEYEYRIKLLSDGYESGKWSLDYFVNAYNNHLKWYTVYPIAYMVFLAPFLDAM